MKPSVSFSSSTAAPTETKTSRKFIIFFQILVVAGIALRLLNVQAAKAIGGSLFEEEDKDDENSRLEFYLRGEEKTFHEKHCLYFASMVEAFAESTTSRASEKSEIEEQSVSQNTYTVVISTYDRDNELIKNVDHWLSCPLVNQVQVLWHNPDREPPKMLKDMAEEYDCSDVVDLESEEMKLDYSPKRLWLRQQTVDKLSNRWRSPEEGFQTEAVFNVDDDAVIDCRLMTAAFQEWRALGNHALVGFEPRQIDWTKEDQGYTWYTSCEADQCEYNTLWPTKGAFLHRSLYERFFDDEYASARELVDEHFTGEDILMTYVHFSTFIKATKAPPPILSIQATKDFQREFYNYHSRFGLFEKATLLPSYIMDLLYIDELNSLGLRSSWFRHKIVTAIGELSTELSKTLSVEETSDENVVEDSKFTLPPMVQDWFFLDKDLSSIRATNVCQDKQLFQALRCTTYASLNPVSGRDVVLLTLPFFILFILSGVAIWVHSYRVKVQNYEMVRQRKVSGADISDFYPLHSSN